MEHRKHRNLPIEEARRECYFAPGQERAPTISEDFRAKQMQKNQAAIELLKSWRQGDAQEQRETLAYLKRALDEDRLSDRRRFP